MSEHEVKEVTVSPIATVVSNNSGSVNPNDEFKQALKKAKKIKNKSTEKQHNKTKHRKIKKIKTPQELSSITNPILRKNNTHGKTKKQVRFKLPGESGPTPINSAPIPQTTNMRAKIGGKRQTSKFKKNKRIPKIQGFVRVTLRAPRSQNNTASNNENENENENSIEDKLKQLKMNGVVKSDKINSEDISRIYDLCTTGSTSNILIKRN